MFVNARSQTQLSLPIIVQEFTALLKQTVEAKRLSGGKVQEVVQLGVKFLRVSGSIHVSSQLTS